MTPKETIKEFFGAWQAQQWLICLSLAQMSWKHQQLMPDRGWWQNISDWFIGIDYSNRPQEHLQLKLGQWDINNIEEIQIIPAPDMNPDVVKDALVKVELGDGSLSTFRCRMVNEIAPYSPSGNGSWGVNITSIQLWD